MWVGREPGAARRCNINMRLYDVQDCAYCGTHAAMGSSQIAGDGAQFLTMCYVTAMRPCVYKHSAVCRPDCLVPIMVFAVVSRYVLSDDRSHWVTVASPSSDIAADVIMCDFLHTGVTFSTKMQIAKLLAAAQSSL